jgi:hypothetical protein
MLCDGCIRKESVETICWDMAIEAPQLYRWKKRFEEQKDRYLGVLESARYSAGRAMEWLTERKDYVVEFAGKYLRRTEKIPMQSHANPTNTRQPVFSQNDVLRKPHSMKWRAVQALFTMDSS